MSTRTADAEKMKENDIRPQALFERYLQLAQRDAETHFADKSGFVTVACPACGNDSSRPGLEKLGFHYVVCRACDSLYLSPRPDREALDHYYRTGEAVKFWSSHFFRETAEARRVRMFRPRAEQIAGLARGQGTGQLADFVDVGSGFGIFLEEMARQNCFAKVTGIEPGPDLAETCRQRGFPILQKPVEAIAEDELQVDFATAFEVIEHVFDPRDFLLAIRRILRPGGVVFFTTLTVSGFDIQELWEHSNSVHPPHHINLMSVQGFRQLVGRAGFVLQDLSTPGKLDVDIVRNAWQANPSIPRSRFADQLLRHTDPTVQQELQDFLRRHRLSSHVQVVAVRSEQIF